MSFLYTSFVGVPPSYDTMGIFCWVSDYERELLGYCPRERALRYFFSESLGNDANDGLTELTPKRSLAELQSIIDAAPAVADLRFSLKRDDIWTVDPIQSAIVLNKAQITIDAYSTGDPPFINAYAIKYTGGWTQVDGTHHMRSESRKIASILNEADRMNPPIQLQSNLGMAIEAGVSGCWFIDDVADEVHVNFGFDPNTAEIEAVVGHGTSGNINGIEISADGCRVEGIRVHGFGVRMLESGGFYLSSRLYAATQCEPLKNKLSTGMAGVFVDCDAYFGGSHVVAHWNQSSSGGVCGCFSVRAGFCHTVSSSSSGGQNIFNMYARDGGNEFVLHRCTATHGCVPHASWYDSVLRPRHGIGLGAHTSGKPNPFALGITEYFTADTANPHGCTTISDIDHAPPEDPETGFRAFLIDDCQTGGPGTYFPVVKVDTVVINPNWTCQPNSNTAQVMPTSPSSRGIVVNAHWIIDWSARTSSNAGLYNNTTTDQALTFIHGLLLHANVDFSNLACFDYDLRNGTAAGASVTTPGSSQVVVVSSIIVARGTGLNMSLAVNNDLASPKCSHNLVGGVILGAGTARGWDNWPDSEEIFVCPCGSRLATPMSPADGNGLPTTLEYDSNRQARYYDAPTIGPVEIPQCANFCEMPMEKPVR